MPGALSELNIVCFVFFFQIKRGSAVEREGTFNLEYGTCGCVYISFLYQFDVKMEGPRKVFFVDCTALPWSKLVGFPLF